MPRLRTLLVAVLSPSLLFMGTAVHASDVYGRYRRPVVARTDSAAQELPPVQRLLPSGAGISIRTIVDVIDGVGGAIDEPGYYTFALDLVEGLAGPEHAFSGYLHVRLARLLLRHGDEAGALEHALEGERILRTQLRLDLRSLSDTDARRLSRSRESALDMILALASRTRIPEARARCWDAFIRSRALVLDEMASRQTAIVSAGDSTLTTLAGALSEARQRLAELDFATPPDDGRMRSTLARARVRRDSLEREVARRSERFRRDNAIQGAGLAEVRAALRPGDVLIAYAGYAEPAPPSRPHTGVYRALDTARRADRPSLLAFVMRAEEDAPAVVALGSSVAVDSLVAAWRRALLLAPGGGPTAAARVRALGDSIRRRAWDPLAPRIQGAKRILIVLDGTLQLINLSALPSRSGSGYLIEELPAEVLLTAERDIVRGSAQAPPGGGLLAMSPASTHIAPDAARALDAARGAAGQRNDGAPCEFLRTERLSELPASALEVEDVAALWRDAPRHGKGLDYEGATATEAAFRAHCAGQRLVHLATHGFFLHCSGTDGARQARGSRGDDFAPPAAGQDSPLLRSGLVFSEALGATPEPDAPDDGILSAEEVGALDLSRARLVVLSACETGLGTIEGHEGLLGLRRAFAVAGAGSVVASLWRADDRATRVYMHSFYVAWLERGLDVSAALHEAGLAVLGERRRSGRDTSPLYWGAFVATGDAGP